MYQFSVYYVLNNQANLVNTHSFNEFIKLLYSISEYSELLIRNNHGDLIFKDVKIFK